MGKQRRQSSESQAPRYANTEGYQPQVKTTTDNSENNKSKENEVTFETHSPLVNEALKYRKSVYESNLRGGIERFVFDSSSFIEGRDLGYVNLETRQNVPVFLFTEELKEKASQFKNRWETPDAAGEYFLNNYFGGLSEEERDYDAPLDFERAKNIIYGSFKDTPIKEREEEIAAYDKIFSKYGDLTNKDIHRELRYYAGVGSGVDMKSIIDLTSQYSKRGGSLSPDVATAKFNKDFSDVMPSVSRFAQSQGEVPLAFLLHYYKGRNTPFHLASDIDNEVILSQTTNLETLEPAVKLDIESIRKVTLPEVNYTEALESVADAFKPLHEISEEIIRVNDYYNQAVSELNSFKELNNSKELFLAEESNWLNSFDGELAESYRLKSEELNNISLEKKKDIGNFLSIKNEYENLYNSMDKENPSEKDKLKLINLSEKLRDSEVKISDYISLNNELISLSEKEELKNFFINDDHPLRKAQELYNKNLALFKEEESALQNEVQLLFDELKAKRIIAFEESVKSLEKQEAFILFEELTGFKPTDINESNREDVIDAFFSSINEDNLSSAIVNLSNRDRYKRFELSGVLPKIKEEDSAWHELLTSQSYVNASVIQKTNYLVEAIQSSLDTWTDKYGVDASGFTIDDIKRFTTDVIEDLNNKGYIYPSLHGLQIKEKAKTLISPEIEAEMDSKIKEYESYLINGLGHEYEHREDIEKYFVVRDILDDILNTDDRGLKKGIITNIKEVLYGASDAKFISYLPFISTLHDNNQKSIILDVLNRKLANENMNEMDLLILETLSINDVQNAYIDTDSYYYKGKTGFPKTVSFMLELMAGQKVMTSFVNKLPLLAESLTASRFSNILTNGNIRSILFNTTRSGKIIPKTEIFSELSSTAKAALTLTSGNVATGLNVINGYLERITPHHTVDLNTYYQTGELISKIEASSSNNPLLKSFGSNFIETTAEYSGNLIGRGLAGAFFTNPARATSINSLISDRISQSKIMTDLSKRAMLARGLATFTRQNAFASNGAITQMQSLPIEQIEEVISNGAQVLFLGERKFEDGFINDSAQIAKDTFFIMSPLFGLRFGKNLTSSLRSTIDSAIHIQANPDQLGIVSPSFDINKSLSNKIKIRRSEYLAAKGIIDDLKNTTSNTDIESLESIRRSLLGIANPTNAKEKGIIKGNNTRRVLENVFLLHNEFSQLGLNGTFGDYLDNHSEEIIKANQVIDQMVENDLILGREGARSVDDFSDGIEMLNDIAARSLSDIRKRDIRMTINTILSFAKNRKKNALLKDYLSDVERIQDNINKRIYNSKILGKSISLGSLTTDIRKLEEITGENLYQQDLADIERNLAFNPVLNFDNSGIFLNERSGKTYREEFDELQTGDAKILLGASRSNPDIIAIVSESNGERLLTLNITEEQFNGLIENFNLSSGMYKELMFALTENGTVFSDGKPVYNKTLEIATEMVSDAFDDNVFYPGQILKGLSIMNKLVSSHPGSSNIDVTDMLIQNFRGFDMFGWKKSDGKYYVDQSTYKAAVSMLLSAGGLRGIIKKPNELIKETEKFIIVNDSAYEQYTGLLSDYLPEDLDTQDVEEYLEPAIKASDITIDKLFDFKNMKESDIVKSVSILLEKTMGLGKTESVDYAKMLDRIASGLVASGLYTNKIDALRELPLYEWSSAFEVTNDSITSRLNGSNSKKNSARLFFDGILNNIAVRSDITIEEAKKRHRISYVENDLTESELKRQASLLLGVYGDDLELFDVKKGNGYNLVLFDGRSLILFDNTANHESLIEASVRLSLNNTSSDLYDITRVMAKGKSEDDIVLDIMYGLKKGKIKLKDQKTFLDKAKSALSDLQIDDRNVEDHYLDAISLGLKPFKEAKRDQSSNTTSINIQVGILKGVEMRYDALNQVWTFFKDSNPVSFVHAVADWYYDKVMESNNSNLKRMLQEATSSYLSKINPDSSTKSANWYKNEVERIRQFNPGITELQLANLLSKSVFAKSVEIYMSGGSALRISEINNQDGTTSYRNVKVNTALGKVLSRFVKFFTQYTIDNIDNHSIVGKGITTQAARAIGTMMNVRIDNSSILKDHDMVSLPKYQLSNKEALSFDKFQSLYNYIVSLGDGIREEDMEMAKEELVSLAMKVKQELIESLIEKGQRLPFSKKDLASLIFTPRHRTIEGIKNNLSRFEKIINDASRLKKISDLREARRLAKNNFDSLKKKDYRFYSLLKGLSRIPVEALALEDSHLDLFIDIFSKNPKDLSKNDYNEILPIAREFHEAYLEQKRLDRIESENSLKTKASIAKFLEENGLTDIEILNLTNQRKDKNDEYKSAGTQAFSRMYNPDSLEHLDELYEEALDKSLKERKELVSKQQMIMSRGLLDENNAVNDLALDINVNDLSSKELTVFSSMLAKAGETGKFDTEAVNFIFDYHAKRNDNFIKNSVGRLFKDMIEDASDPSYLATLRKNFHWLPISLSFKDDNGNKTKLPRLKLSLGSIAHYTLSQMSNILDGMTYDMKGHVSNLLTEPLEIAEARRQKALFEIMKEFGDLKKDMSAEELTVAGIYSLLNQKASFSFSDFFDLSIEDLQDENGNMDETSEELFNIINELKDESNGIKLSELKAKGKMSYSDFFVYDETLGEYIQKEGVDLNSIEYRIYDAMNRRKLRNVAASIIYSLNGDAAYVFPEFERLKEVNTKDRFSKVKASNMRMHNIIVAEGLARKYGSVENLVKSIYEGNFNADEKIKKLNDFNRKTFYNIRNGVYSGGMTMEHVVTDINGQPFSPIEDYTPLIRYDEVTDKGSIDRSGTVEMEMANTSGEGAYLSDVDVMKTSLNVNDNFLKKRNGSSVSLLEVDMYEMIKRRVDQELFYLNHEAQRKLLVKMFSMDNGFFSKWKSSSADKPKYKFEEMIPFKDGEDMTNFRLDENASREFNLRFSAFYLRNMTPSKIDLRRSPVLSYISDVSNYYKSFLLSGTHASIGQLSVLLNLPPEFENSVGSGGINSMIGAMEGIAKANDERFNRFLLEQAPEVALRGISEFDYANINVKNLSERILLVSKMLYDENSSEMNIAKRFAFRLESAWKDGSVSSLSNLFENFDRSGSYRDADVLLMNVLAFDRLASKAAFYAGYKAFVNERGKEVDWANPDKDGVNYAVNLVRRTQNSDSSLWRSGINLGIMPGMDTYNQKGFGEFMRQQFFSFRSFTMNEATNQRRNSIMALLEDKRNLNTTNLGGIDLLKGLPQIASIFSFGMANRLAYEVSKEFAMRMLMFVPITAYLYAGWDQEEEDPFKEKRSLFQSAAKAMDIIESIRNPSGISIKEIEEGEKWKNTEAGKEEFQYSLFDKARARYALGNILLKASLGEFGASNGVSRSIAFYGTVSNLISEYKAETNIDNDEDGNEKKSIIPGELKYSLYNQSVTEDVIFLTSLLDLMKPQGDIARAIRGYRNKDNWDKNYDDDFVYKNRKDLAVTEFMKYSYLVNLLLTKRPSILPYPGIKERDFHNIMRGINKIEEEGSEK